MRIYLEIIQKDVRSIRQIPNPSEELQLFMIEQNKKHISLGCVLKQNIAQIQEMLYSKRKL